MNVFELAAKISVDTGDYVKGLADASAQGVKTLSGIVGTVGKIGKIAVTSAAAGVSAAGAMVTAIGKNAIAGYANYEQLIGGIKKLYGDSAKGMIDDANNAYQKLGWSANDYLQTVTTFSASLLKSVGNDTETARIMANVAMADMSDNANTFGTDMARIQSAYMGFAKGNFMMLDNLNLGYSGTKQGMKDLIAHANELRKAQGLTGSLTIDSFSDIIEAIHLVQKELKITGTSEKEAATTLEGSLKSMKAAWANYINALADKNEYLTVDMAHVMAATKTYIVDNLVPAIERFADGFANAIGAISPYLQITLPSLIEKVAPKVAQGASKLLIAVGKSLPKIAKPVLKSGINGIIDVANALLGTKIPKIRAIRWPTWKDVEQAATVAWDTIQYGFKSIAKLVLGDDFNADDSWIQVGSKIFEKIKSGVHGAGELIYKLLNPGAGTSEMTPSQLWVGVGKSIWDAIVAGIADVAELIAMFINPDIDFTRLTPDQRWQLIGSTIFEAIKSGIGFVGDLITSIVAPDIDLSQFKASPQKWGVIGNAIFTAIGNGTLKVFEFIASLMNPELDFSQYEANPDKWGAVGEALWQGILNGVKDIGDFIDTLLNPEADVANMTAGQVWEDIGKTIIDGISSGVGATTDFISKLILGEGYTEGDPTANWTEVGKKIREWIDGLFAAPQEGEDGAEGLGTKLWNAIWNGITSGVTGAGDLLYGLIVGNEAEGNLTSAEKWQQIGRAILDGINTAFVGTTDFLYSLIVGTEVPNTSQEKWAGIGNAILNGIRSAFSTATDFLYGLIVGDGEAATSESKKWEVIGNAILNGIRDAFTSASDFLYTIIVGGETPATNPEKWSAIGEAVLGGIKSAFTTAGDFMYTLIVGDGKAAQTATTAEKWKYVGEAVLGGIRLAANNATDFLYNLLVGDGKENLTTAEKWEAIGGALLDGISNAVNGVGNFLMKILLGDDFNPEGDGNFQKVGQKIHDWITDLFKAPEEGAEGQESLGARIWKSIKEGITRGAENATDFLYGLLVGEGDAETLAQKWSGIGEAILDGIKFAVGSTSDFLLRLVLGDAYSGNFDADWVQVGKNISGWVQKLFEPSEGGEETLGSKIWSAIWSGITSAAQGAGDLLLGLIVGPDSEVKSWSDYGKQLWEDFTSMFKLPDNVINFYNRMVDLLNKLGLNLKHYDEEESLSDVTKSVEEQESYINKLVTSLQLLLDTYGQSAQFTGEWKDTLAELERLVPGISGAFTDENGKIAINTKMVQENIAAWKELALQKAINAGLEKQAEALTQASTDKMMAESKLLNAEQSLETFRSSFTDLIKQVFGLEKGVFDGNEVGAMQQMLTELEDAGADVDVSKFEKVSGAFQKMLTAGSWEEFNAAMKGFDLEGFLGALSPDEMDTALSKVIESGKYIQELNGLLGFTGQYHEIFSEERLAQYNKAIQDYKDAVAEMENAQTRYNDALKHYEEFYTAAQNALNAAQTSGSEATSTVTALGKELNKLPNEKVIRVVINEDGSLIDNPGHTAKGLNYVPVNDYLTRLHKGEAVLSANQAREWRNGVRSGLDTELIANAVKGAITEAMGNMAFVMNGKQVVNAIGGRMSKSMSGFQKADSAGYGR